MMFGRKMLLKTSLCSAILSAALNASAANCKRLEHVYMANVGLSMRDQDLAKSIQVNKKCTDHIRMLRRLEIDAFILFSRGAMDLASNVVTLDFTRNFLGYAEEMRGIDKVDREKIANIFLGKYAAEELSEPLFKQTIIDLFPQLKEIEIHTIESDILHYLVYNKVVVCQHIDITTLKRKNAGDKQSLVQLGDSNVRVIFKNILVCDSLTESNQTLELKKIFEDVTFSEADALYRE